MALCTQQAVSLSVLGNHILIVSEPSVCGHACVHTYISLHPSLILNTVPIYNLSEVLRSSPALRRPHPGAPAASGNSCPLHVRRGGRWIGPRAQGMSVSFLLGSKYLILFSNMVKVVSEILIDCHETRAQYTTNSSKQCEDFILGGALFSWRI